jgi:hypothetical protein
MKRYVELKIKIINLADEAKTIRANEIKLTGNMRADLHNHRVTVVRHVARHNLLAYGFLRGKAYKSMEQSCYEKPNLEEILKHVLKFGGAQATAIPQGALEENIYDWYRGRVWPSQMMQAAE